MTKDTSVRAPITSVDRTGVERIVVPSVGDYQPAQVEPTQAQVDAAEERNATWGEQAARRTDGVGQVTEDPGAPNAGETQPVGENSAHNSVMATPPPDRSGPAGLGGDNVEPEREETQLPRHDGEPALGTAASPENKVTSVTTEPSDTGATGVQTETNEQAEARTGAPLVPPAPTGDAGSNHPESQTPPAASAPGASTP